MTPADLSAALASLGWSGRELARRLGCDQGLVKRWGLGQTTVPAPVAKWLARLVASVERHPPPTDWRARGEGGARKEGGSGVPGGPPLPGAGRASDALPLWLGDAPLVLASASPTRAALLAAAGLPFEAQDPGVDERLMERAAGPLDPAAAAALLARAKALAVSARRPGRLVLGADQTLDLDGERFTKPADRAAARDQLARLAGRAHRLTAALALARDGAVLWEGAGEARMTMRALTDDAADRYLAAAGDDALGSVGAYRAEGLGAHLFDAVEGEHAAVLGLPLRPLLAELRRMGLVP